MCINKKKKTRDDDYNADPLIDSLFCIFQEIITLIADTLIQIIMYQKLKLVTLMF